VLLVNAKGNIEQRSFETERAVNNAWLVRSGVKAGERIVVNGTQKVQVGMPVNAKEIDSASFTTASTNQ